MRLIDTMEYENLKWLRRESQTITGADDSELISQPQNVRTSVVSDGSTQSVAYQTFYLEGDAVPLPGQESPQDGCLPTERRQAASTSATYSYPCKPKEANKGDEDEYAYAMTVDVLVSKQKQLKSHSVTELKIPAALPLSITDRPLPLPPPVLADVNQTVTELNTGSVRDSSQPGVASLPPLITDQPSQLSPCLVSATELNDSTSTDATRADSDSIPAPEAVAPDLTQTNEQSSSLLNPRMGSTDYPSEASISVGAKPLVMKMFPLYLSMDGRKIYADRNATSIPTHHLVEVTVMGNLEQKCDAPQSAKPLPPLPQVG